VPAVVMVTGLVDGVQVAAAEPARRAQRSRPAVSDRLTCPAPPRPALPPLRAEMTAGHGSSGSTNLSGSRGSRVKKCDPLSSLVPSEYFSPGITHDHVPTEVLATLFHARAYPEQFSKSAMQKLLA